MGRERESEGREKGWVAKGKREREREGNHCIVVEMHMVCEWEW